ncbi:MAG: sigma-70 family RNA polymerase sigma factor [Anaerolineae bacterium]|nr:sigma-70 family RNA polymerase sigma factor [Anaerolineae bacterium]
MDELAIIQRAQQGDLDAFNQLVLTYQSLAFNVAFRILSDRAEADDATQTAFISAFTKIDHFQGGSFRAWLMRIVTNACYDELRRKKRRPTVELEPTDPESGEEFDSPSWLADDSVSPEEAAELTELDQAVQHCLENLPEDFRVVAVMVDIQGMDYQDVCEIVGTPLGTIKSRVSRARQRLQQCLQQFQELLPLKFRFQSNKVI